MLAAEAETVMALREEAHDRALWLNKGEPGILAGPEAPGCVLERETAASSGTVPLWGQSGEFVIEACGMLQRHGAFFLTTFYQPRNADQFPPEPRPKLCRTLVSGSFQTIFTQIACAMIFLKDRRFFEHERTTAYH